MDLIGADRPCRVSTGSPQDGGRDTNGVFVSGRHAVSIGLPARKAESVRQITGRTAGVCRSQASRRSRDTRGGPARHRRVATDDAMDPRGRVVPLPRRCAPGCPVEPAPTRCRSSARSRSRRSQGRQQARRRRGWLLPEGGDSSLGSPDKYCQTARLRRSNLRTQRNPNECYLTALPCRAGRTQTCCSPLDCRPSAEVPGTRTPFRSTVNSPPPHLPSSTVRLTRERISRAILRTISAPTRRARVRGHRRARCAGSADAFGRWLGATWR